MSTFNELEILNNDFPITLPFRKNLEKAPYFGDEFAQDIEPAGDYINYHEHHNYGMNIPNYCYGMITFSNPLVMEWETTSHGGWKTKLSQKYNGLTGKKLSQAIILDGYDGIITIDTEFGTFQEIVNLKGLKQIF